MAADILNQIANEQRDRNRILTGWFLTPLQIAAILDDLAPHGPHPDVGGLGRLDSVPVFPIDSFQESIDSAQTDQCDGIRFTFVQMGVVN